MRSISWIIFTVIFKICNTVAHLNIFKMNSRAVLIVICEETFREMIPSPKLEQPREVFNILEGQINCLGHLMAHIS